MLLCVDLSLTHRQLTAGELRCPARDCGGRLAPWGFARARTVRDGLGARRCYTPRRGRCRTCARTQVLASAVTFPRRVDSAETVVRALLSAAEGLGHRRVAELVDRPATTVRDWLRRARANAERAESYATRWALALEAAEGPRRSRGDALAEVLNALGHAIAARTRRFGPAPARWEFAVVVTGGLLLAPPGHGLLTYPLHTR